MPEKQNGRIIAVMRNKTDSVAPPQIQSAILPIRGQRVLLDRDLAALYGVTTSNLKNS